MLSAFFRTFLFANQITKKEVNEFVTFPVKTLKKT